MGAKLTGAKLKRSNQPSVGLSACGSARRARAARAALSGEGQRGPFL